jgi:hypothetical protein
MKGGVNLAATPSLIPHQLSLDVEGEHYTVPPQHSLTSGRDRVHDQVEVLTFDAERTWVVRYEYDQDG